MIITTTINTTLEINKLEGDDLICDKCGSKLVEIGVKSRKEILKYIPGKLIVEEHVMYSERL